MKKLLALLFIFVSLSSLKAGIQPPIGNSGTSEELTRESVSVPTQKQVQDVPVHGKPTWGETIKAMYNQHPKKFVGSVALPMSKLIVDTANVVLICKKLTSVPNSPEKVMKVISMIYGDPSRAVLSYLIYGSASIAGFSYIYCNTEVSIQGTPKVELSDDKN